jgi:hypothetical protein
MAIQLNSSKLTEFPSSPQWIHALPCVVSSQTVTETSINIDNKKAPQLQQRHRNSSDDSPLQLSPRLTRGTKPFFDPERAPTSPRIPRVSWNGLEEAAQQSNMVDIRSFSQVLPSFPKFFMKLRSSGSFAIASPSHLTTFKPQESFIHLQVSVQNQWFRVLGFW